MKTNQKLCRMLTALALAAALTGTAVAASTITTKTIEAQYMGISLVVDGVAVTPKDASGNVVEPFVSEGTTYLPVRAVADALGKSVTWDGETKTVYIGQVPGTTESWMTKLPPFETGLATVYDGTDPKASFQVGGVTKTEGVVLADTSYSNPAYAIWNTNCLYKTMTFTIAHSENVQKIQRGDENGVLDIYLDGELSTTYELQWDGAPQTITVPLNYAARVKLNLNGTGHNRTTEFSVYDISFSE